MNLYRVSLNRYPLQGLLDATGTFYTSPPFAMHYRDPDSGAWYTEQYLTDEMGVPEAELKKIKRDWRARMKARQDFSSDLYETVVIEATSPGDAKEKFMNRFGVNDTLNRHWNIREGEEGDIPWQLLDPKVKRALSQK